MDNLKLWVWWLALATFAPSCADGEAGLGVFREGTGGAFVGGAGAASTPFGLDDFCSVTCKGIAALDCERESGHGTCEARCLRIPLPTPDAPCYAEEAALVRCQYDNAETAFEC